MDTGIAWLERTWITSLEATVMVGAIWLLLRLLRGALSPAWRYGLWTLLIAKMLLPWLPGSPENLYQWLHLPSSIGQGVPVLMQAENAPDAAGLEKPDVASTMNDANAVSPPSLDTGYTSLMEIVWWTWLAGASSIVALIGSGYFRTRLALRREGYANPPDELLKLFAEARQRSGIRRGVCLRLTSIVQAPTLFGILRPAVLIPMRLVGSLEAQEWACIFHHELAHFKRRDVAVNTLAALLAAVHWFNPAIWYGLHRMRIEQEEACDASVLAAAPSQDTYASCMIKVLELGVTGRVAWTGVGFFGYKNQVARRMRMIRDYSPSKRRASLIGCGILVAAALLFLPSAFAADQRTPAPLTDAEDQPAFVQPVPGILVSPYGERVHPISKERTLHDGIDITNKEKTPIHAAADGKVVEVSYDKKNGNRIVIEHAGSWTTEYRHLHEMKTKAGQQVKSGDVIGLMGSTGEATGPHLHFSMMKDGAYRNPIFVYSDD